MGNSFIKNVKNKPAIKMVLPAGGDQFKKTMKENHPRELYFAHSFRPVYYISRFFGLMPFSIIYGLDGKAHEPRVSVLDNLWFMIAVCLYMTLTSLISQNIGVPKGPNIPVMLVFTYDMILVVGLAFGAAIAVMDMWNRSKFVEILKIFHTFDKEVISQLKFGPIPLIIHSLFQIVEQIWCFLRLHK